MAERAVGTVKKTLDKARQSGQNLDMSLLSLRSTPVDDHLPFPARILLGRQVSTSIPSCIRPSTGMQEWSNRLEERPSIQKSYYDQHAWPMTRWRKDNQYGFSGYNWAMDPRARGEKMRRATLIHGGNAAWRVLPAKSPTSAGGFRNPQSTMYEAPDDNSKQRQPMRQPASSCKTIRK